MRECSPPAWGEQSRFGASMTSRVLVTGGSGFVANALFSVRQSTFEFVAASRRRIDLEGARWLQSPELSASANWRPLLEGIDSVVHLAGRVHLPSHDNPSSYLAKNCEGTLKLANDSVEAGVKRFVFMSSAKVLGGESGAFALDETASPRPQDPYSASKLAAEQSLASLGDRLQITILRPPLVYGPGVKANFFALLSAVARGLPLPLASISNKRSLIGVKNLASAIQACLVSPKAAGHTFHVTDGFAVSTPGLVRSIATAFGKSARLFAFPPALIELLGAAVGRGGRVKSLTRSLELDDRGIRSELGWKPIQTFESGLAETVNWYSALHKSAR